MGSTQGDLKNYIITIETPSQTIYTGTRLFFYVWEIKKKPGIDPILKRKIIKNSVNISVVINIASYVSRKI